MQASPTSLRYGAGRFATGASDLRYKASRVKTYAIQTQWVGEAGTAFRQVCGILISDLQKAADALERTAAELGTLATRMEQIENLRRQIMYIEQDLWNLPHDEQYRPARVNLSHQLNNLRQQAERESREADQRATSAFQQIQGDLHSMHFYAQDRRWWDDLLSGLKATGGFVVGVGEAVVDAVVGIFESIAHLDETFANLVHMVEHPILTGEAIWQQVSDSWTRDVTNGDAYSAGKWWGQAVGGVILSIIGNKGADKVSLLTKVGRTAEGAGEVASTTTVLSLTNKLWTGSKEGKLNSERLQEVLGPSFDSQIEEILKKYDIDINREEFLSQKNRPLDETWSSLDDQMIVKQVRETIILEKGVVMQKIIGREKVTQYVEEGANTVGGFTARYQDVAELKTAHSLKEELRLDYNPFWDPHHPQNKNPFYNKKYPNLYLNELDQFKDDPVFALRFHVDNPNNYQPPFKSVPEIKEQYPLTGNGFAGGSTSVIPEFEMKKGTVEVLARGAEIYKVNPDGTQMLVARYNGRKWIIVVENW
ncbi:WXG100 family type VII secretion target [Tumebacillus permanentifrigoris]|uniref:Type VII secretion system (Wss) protein ESAT-6 n=1 Tax=Tumebacillus permanentifrigoris TaxID=378543 RepID=A0A316D504_9BACL|nr:WXG100 family type VII secretion target [Tumebacillus permanentifrigoris]PWK05647.1 type VII secretion system (Wss) protein ESAT-6 [Tumebacillus permanentifrigoris]